MTKKDFKIALNRSKIFLDFETELWKICMEHDYFEPWEDYKKIKEKMRRYTKWQSTPSPALIGLTG